MGALLIIGFCFAISLITLLGHNGIINNLFNLGLDIYGWPGTITAQILAFLPPDTYLMITGEANFEMGSVLSVILITPCIIIFFIHNYLIKC